MNLKINYHNKKYSHGIFEIYYTNCFYYQNHNLDENIFGLISLFGYKRYYGIPCKHLRNDEEDFILLWHQNEIAWINQLIE